MIKLEKGFAPDALKLLSASQQAQLAAYEQQLRTFNAKINLISPETVDELHERHVVHSLALTVRRFPPGSIVVDWGTGGGLPSIPLAIAFPDVQVHGVDSVGKKIQAVRTMARRAGADNLEAWHARAEAWQHPVHYSVSRATAPLRDLWSWHAAVQEPLPDEIEIAGECWRPGLICLKGGVLADEVADLEEEFGSFDVHLYPLQPTLQSAYFDDKYLVEVRPS